MKALAATLENLLCGALAPRADVRTCDLRHFKVALNIGHTLSQPGTTSAGATELGQHLSFGCRAWMSKKGRTQRSQSPVPGH